MRVPLRYNNVITCFGPHIVSRAPFFQRTAYKQIANNLDTCIIPGWDPSPQYCCITDCPFWKVLPGQARWVAEHTARDDRRHWGVWVRPRREEQFVPIPKAFSLAAASPPFLVPPHNVIPHPGFPRDAGSHSPGWKNGERHVAYGAGHDLHDL